ncbi:MAG: DUF3185 domain-containing protein [Terrimicrobiaceae bacterium]
MRTFGITLVVIGILILVLPNIPFTRKEKVLDIGPVEIVTEKKENLLLAPFFGIVTIAGGAAMVLAAVVTKKR